MRATRSRMGRYLAWLEAERGLRFDDYDGAWRWSTDDPGAFWQSIWDHFDVRSATAPRARARGRVDARGALVPRGPPQLRRACAGAARAASGTDVVVVAHVADAGPRRAHRGRAARRGRPLPRRPRAARRPARRPGRGVPAQHPRDARRVPRHGRRSARSGRRARRSSGRAAVVDRFAQIEPVVLLAIDGYRYGDRDGRPGSRGGRDPGRAAVAACDGRRPVPAARVPGDGGGPRCDGVGGAARRRTGRSTFEPVPFDHPLYVLYSSGTTGLPKADRPRPRRHPARAPQGAGAAHGPRAGDRFFWFTTTGWMMWNYLVSGLAGRARRSSCSTATRPGPTSGRCGGWPPTHGSTYLGRRAPFLMACREAGLAPGRDRARPLARCAASGSTGRAAAGRRASAGSRDAVSDAIPVGSLSGGTDVCTGFVGPSPLRAGAGRARSAAGCSARRSRRSTRPGGRSSGAQGELVITAPMPSMPVGFWGDADGSRYGPRTSTTIPGVWRHGDWITITERGSCLITGRCDATLNRGGVRLGTAEFYAVVEAPAGGRRLARRPPRGRGRRPGRAAAVRRAPRTGRPSTTSSGAGSPPRCGPTCRRATCRTRSIAVPAIPRTLSGKKLEVPVKRILLGMDPELAASKDALADPASLEPRSRPCGRAAPVRRWRCSPARRTTVRRSGRDVRGPTRPSVRTRDHGAQRGGERPHSGMATRSTCSARPVGRRPVLPGCGKDRQDPIHWAATERARVARAGLTPPRAGNVPFPGSAPGSPEPAPSTGTDLEVRQVLDDRDPGTEEPRVRRPVRIGRGVDVERVDAHERRALARRGDRRRRARGTGYRAGTRPSPSGGRTPCGRGRRARRGRTAAARAHRSRGIPSPSRRPGPRARPRAARAAGPRGPAPSSWRWNGLSRYVPVLPHRVITSIANVTPGA